MCQVRGDSLVKLALIGLGRWAENIIRSLPPGVEISTVATRREDAKTVLPSAEVVRRVQDLPLHATDGVIIANEARMHESAAVEVWMHRPDMPMFIEKPFPLGNLRGDLPGHLGNKCWTLLVDHTQLFNQGLVGLKRDMDSVPPAFIRGADRGPGPVRTNCNPLWDYGPHAIAIALYLSGFPFEGGIHVRDAWLDTSPGGCTVDFELQLGAKTVATYSVGNNALNKARHCSVRSLGGVVRTWEGLAACPIPPLTAALAAFCSAVEAGHAPEGDVRFGWKLPFAVTQTLTEIEEVLRKRCTPLN